MSKVLSALDDRLREFIAAQQMFFVATAPADGHLNLSPKGLDTLRVLDDRTVAYLDFVGSGVETIAHLKENGRIVLMFCAFHGPPKIVRLHGEGDVIEPSSPEFGALRGLFPDYAGARAIIRVRCERISDSCGYAVPIYEFKSHRTKLTDWAESKGPDGLAEYQRQKNGTSIDVLPGL
jgi:hypothetical protein